MPRPIVPVILAFFALAAAACGSAPPPAAVQTPAAVQAASLNPVAAVVGPATDVTLRYDVVFGTRVAGGSVLVRHADGSYDADYEYTDRGRGPKLHTHTEVGESSIPTRIETLGTDYLHDAVHELATCSAQRCKWDSEREHGEGPYGYYSSLEGGAPDEVLLRAIRSAPGGTLPLLPGGSLHAARVADLEVEGHGERRHVVAWEISGFGLYPGITWFDDDGTVFADVSDYQTTIREGWEDAAPRLLAAERTLGVVRREKIATAVAHRPERGLAIIHAHLFDPTMRKTTNDATIVIEGDRVKSVAPKGAAPAGFEVIDAKGKAVLPGLWDMHVHLSDEESLLDIAEGITTVRDLGNEVDSSLARRARFDTGKELGPHVILAGIIDGSGPFQGPFGPYVDTVDEARAAVDAYAAKGYVQIKIYSSLKPELVPTIVKEAHAKGMRVSGHVPAHMIAEDAVNAGFDEIQHINFLVLDLVADRTTETQTPLRLTIPAEKAAGIDLDAPKTKALVDLLVTRHTVIDSTLAAFERILTVRADHPSQILAPVLSRLPPEVQRGAFSGGLPVPEGMDATFKESFKRCEQLVKRLWDRHVTIVAGTDAFAGLALHRELELYSEAGIPNADVLAIATIGAARVMKRDKTSGSISPGKDADLILVDGDPLANMRDIRNVVTVVKGGTVIDARAAQAALSIAPPP